MHRTDAQDNVGNLFSDGDSVAGRPGTLVDAAWLNAVQEEISGFIEAQGITLVKGTNTQLATALAKWLMETAHDFTAKQTFSGASGDTNAAVVLGGTPTTRKLKAELPTSNATIRLYADFFGAFEITTNAKWTGTNWMPDVTGMASKLSLGGGIFSLRGYSATSETAFADSAWVQQAKLPSDGMIAFTGVTTGASGSNPPASTAIANELRAKNVCKAWGTIAKDASSATLLDGFNVASVSKASDLIQVSFASALADANYAVSLSWDGFTTGSTIGVLNHVSKYTTGFSIQGVSAADGTQCLFSGSVSRIDFMVFGKQSS